MNDHPAITQLVAQLGLLPHPEGGFYAETYRSDTMIPAPQGMRPASTAIYFLLTQGNFSAFHRIKSDECWHHYGGDAVHIHTISPQGHYACHLLGSLQQAGHRPQLVVPAGTWFGSEAIGPAGYALTGCTVAPGFDFADFELADRQQLTAVFPQHAAIIFRLTR